MKDMIKRIREEREGFTLAELLIVVAIIAVLVAIAIPVFNSQLEKSREATDAANVRAAYAEVAAAQISGDKTDVGNVKVTANTDGTYTYTATVTAVQKEADWQDATLKDGKIGGQTVAASTKGWTISGSSNSSTITIEVQ